MIICFEGPSAIGKTTLSQSLSTKFKIIPEVNQLFNRTGLEDGFWYYQKQVERFQMAKQSYQSTILDGDVFQPLWYNWIYGYPEAFPSKTETHHFFQSQIGQGQLTFPDLYIVFHTTAEQLRQRKLADTQRIRRNFEKHLKFIRPQQEYFRYLNTLGVPVAFIEYNDLDKTKQKVLEMIASTQVSAKSHLAIFQKIIEWFSFA